MSVTAPKGFVASGVHAGIKRKRLDLALVAGEGGAMLSAAGVFTQNAFAAPPVRLCREVLERTGGRVGGVIVNSGNANAGTGARGLDDARAMQSVAADAAGAAAETMLVCSTGLIGDFLPMDKIAAAGPNLKQQLSEEGGEDAANAILTTDTHAKTVVVEGDGFRVGGMVKGAGMMAPNMATMICVLTTDAQADPETLRAVLKDAVGPTFNSLTIDGCTSTNDTCLLLASGKGAAPSREALTDAVSRACAALALELARDAEGATKVVRVRVRGAENVEAARKCARQIAESSLVKCSFFGELPYWGRVLCEAGVAGVAMDPEKSSVAYGGVLVADGGLEIPFDEKAAIKAMQQDEWDLDVCIGEGPGVGEVLTVDLTHDYIKENMGRS